MPVRRGQAQGDEPCSQFPADLHPAHRRLRRHWPAHEPGADEADGRLHGRAHAVRQEQRQGLYRQRDRHQIHRRRRGGRGQGEPDGGGGLPPQPPEVPGDRREDAQGRPAGGPSGHRQDPAGQGRGWGGGGALLLHLRLGICGDVRGHGG